MIIIQNGRISKVIGNNNQSIQITDGEIYINGKKVDTKALGIPKAASYSIVVEGDCGSINADIVEKIEVKGSVNGNVSTNSGNVGCKDIEGSVSTMSGDVDARNIEGCCSTMSGDIDRHFKF